MNIGSNNSFGMYDKAMDIVTAVLGEDIVDVFRVSIVNSVCKIVVPMYVSLMPLVGRTDVTVVLNDNTSEIFVH